VHVLQKWYGCFDLFRVYIYKNVQALLGFNFCGSNWKGREWKHFTGEDVLQLMCLLEEKSCSPTILSHSIR